jgi:hypothetical protein
MSGQDKLPLSLITYNSSLWLICFIIVHYRPVTNKFVHARFCNTLEIITKHKWHYYEGKDQIIMVPARATQAPVLNYHN